MKKIKNLIILLLLNISFATFAQQAGEYTTPEKASNEFEFINDNFIAAALDSLSVLK
jgi:hypothetical protein